MRRGVEQLHLVRLVRFRLDARIISRPAGSTVLWLAVRGSRFAGYVMACDAFSDG